MMASNGTGFDCQEAFGRQGRKPSEAAAEQEGPEVGLGAFPGSLFIGWFLQLCPLPMPIGDRPTLFFRGTRSSHVAASFAKPSQGHIK